jgi:Zn-dependent peptidase ImmA (M78 family)
MSIPYESLKALARQKRQEYEVSTDTFGLQKLRQIYKQEGVVIDLWKLQPRIRAVYMCDDGDPSVLVNKTLPMEPRLFAMVHELKHHYTDRKLIEGGKLKCGDYNANQDIEIGAEVFAAEFLYPEQEFLDCLAGLGIQRDACTKEDVVRLKRSCGAPVSYTFLRKRLERMGFAQPGAFDRVQFQKLEEELYGLPIYKQEWFKARRRRRPPVR